MVGYQKDDSMTQNQKLIAGCVSGAMTRFITQPLDVVKLRTQVVKKIFTPAEQKKWFKITRRIYKEEGVTAFWQGHNLGQVTLYCDIRLMKLQSYSSNVSPNQPASDSGPYLVIFTDECSRLRHILNRITLIQKLFSL